MGANALDSRSRCDSKGLIRAGNEAAVHRIEPNDTARSRSLANDVIHRYPLEGHMPLTSLVENANGVDVCH